MVVTVASVAMMPFKKKLVLLLPFLFLTSIIPVVEASLYKVSASLDVRVLLQDTLVELVSGPLCGQDLLVVSDNHSQRLRLLDMGRVMAAAGASLTPVFLVTQDSLLHTTRLPHGLTALIIFSQDPSYFLIPLWKNKNWNPTYLVLFCLNSHFNATSILTRLVVQRSEFILLLQPQGRSGYQRIYAYTSLPTRIKAPLGVWNLDKFPNRQSLFVPRFLNFGGQILRVSAVCEDQPFIYYDEEGHCTGSNLDALQILGEKLNFRITVRDDAFIWGSKENGTWNGILGQVMYEGQHLIINVMQPVPERVNDFDFTYPYWKDGYGIMLRVPTPVPLWRNILYPFSTLMWGLLFATMTIVASTLAILLYFLRIITDPIGFALKVASGLVGQSMPDGEVRVWWARVWLVVWWVAVDILAATYSSNLVAVLTVPVYPDSINTLQELAESDCIPSMLDYKDFVPQAMKTSENPTLATLGKRLYLHPDHNTADLLLTMVLAGTHALIVTVDYLIFLQHEKGLTRITYIMNDEIFSSYMSWFLPKNTPYTTTISNHVTRLVETGILDKLYHDHIGRLTGKEAQVLVDVVLNLEHTQGAFIVMGLGLVAAFITLLIERFV